MGPLIINFAKVKHSFWFFVLFLHEGTREHHKYNLFVISFQKISQPLGGYNNNLMIFMFKLFYYNMEIFFKKHSSKSAIQGPNISDIFVFALLTVKSVKSATTFSKDLHGPQSFSN